MAWRHLLLQQGIIPKEYSITSDIHGHWALCSVITMLTCGDHDIIGIMFLLGYYIYYSSTVTDLDIYNHAQ